MFHQSTSNITNKMMRVVVGLRSKHIEVFYKRHFLIYNVQDISPATIETTDICAMEIMPMSLVHGDLEGY